jgi:hypothetical protein
MTLLPLLPIRTGAGVCSEGGGLQKRAVGAVVEVLRGGVGVGWSGPVKAGEVGGGGLSHHFETYI